MWSPFAFGEHTMLMIDCDPENQARSPKGGIDGYGVEWVYVDVVGGAMVKPGNPICPDITHWEDYVTIPDPDTWDWAGCYERNKEKLSPDRATYIAVPGCLFERLIAILDFQNAAVALIDDEQKEAVNRFFRAVTQVHKKFYKNVKKWFNADIVNFNDDWGSQRAEFFSVETAREMLLPTLRSLLTMCTLWVCTGTFTAAALWRVLCPCLLRPVRIPGAVSRLTISGSLSSSTAINSYSPTGRR